MNFSKREDAALAAVALVTSVAALVWMMTAQGDECGIAFLTSGGTGYGSMILFLVLSNVESDPQKQGSAWARSRTRRACAMVTGALSLLMAPVALATVLRAAAHFTGIYSLGI